MREYRGALDNGSTWYNLLVSETCQESLVSRRSKDV